MHACRHSLPRQTAPSSFGHLCSASAERDGRICSVSALKLMIKGASPTDAEQIVTVTVVGRAVTEHDANIAHTEQRHPKASARPFARVVENLKTKTCAQRRSTFFSKVDRSLGSFL